jgi:GNAT superfamily N-acetyltransferase
LEEVTILPARPHEAGAAGALLMETLYGFGIYQTGLGSAQRGNQALGAYYSLPGNRFSYAFSHMAYIEENLAGMLLAFPGKVFSRLNRKTFLQMPRVYSPGEMLEFFRRERILKDEEEVERDEFYVAHLAVCAPFRRKGVGRALLNYAETLATQKSLSKVSLLAETENHGAIALYERFGFTTVKTYSHPHQIPLTGSPGYVKMVKKISEEEFENGK